MLDRATQYNGISFWLCKILNFVQQGIPFSFPIPLLLSSLADLLLVTLSARSEDTDSDQRLEVVFSSTGLIDMMFRLIITLISNFKFRLLSVSLCEEILYSGIGSISGAEQQPSY